MRSKESVFRNWRNEGLRIELARPAMGVCLWYASNGKDENAMDPISQGALGAVTASSFARSKQMRLAALLGWAGGMLADGDIFIRSASDPLLNIEYHRHFTHSIVFIPIGGFVCGAVFWLFLRKKHSFWNLWRFSTIGYATAGLLDACTSYGTQLLWPFSNARISWNIISIIDPIFTLTILATLIWGFARRKEWLPRVGLAFAILYLFFGVVQNRRATDAGIRLAESRGHQAATKYTVKPSLGNLLLWRSIYEIEGRYYIDAVRVGIVEGSVRYFKGESVSKIDVVELKEKLPESSVLREDVDRFAHFSDGYLIWHPERPKVIGDARYAMLPNGVVPLWGIEFDPTEPQQHAPFLTFRERSPEGFKQLWKMIKGTDALKDSVKQSSSR